METASTSDAARAPLDPGILAAAANRAAEAAGVSTEPARAIDAAVGALHDALPGIFPSVFVLEHARLWLVAQRGYAVVPDGISIESGIMGRSVRLGHAQVADDVRADPDYVSALPGVTTELAVPLRAGRIIVGTLNIESERALPDSAAELVRPLAVALAPLTEALRASRSLDLAGLARLFVHLGSLRDPDEIAALAAASLPRVLPLESSQVVVWDDSGSPAELASWTRDDPTAPALTASELLAARALVDPSVVSQRLDRGSPPLGGRSGESLVWLPLRTNGADLGALACVTAGEIAVDASQLDVAAVLAAHVAASLDAAVALRTERQSAVTDSLTGILNRRGLEERFEEELADAQARRVPVSILVIDCDDFKDINDRAGHEFGDALLQEVASVLGRALPEGGFAARLGGDEFVVLLPGAGDSTAEAVGSRIRDVLAEGLTDAGYPLRISAGISTYPFDGATPTALLRAADQALYAAKEGGKDRVASFREVRRPAPVDSKIPAGAVGDERRGSRGDGSVLAEAVAAAEAIEREETANGVCERLCKALVFVVGATACSASRVTGDLLVDATEHALRDISLGTDTAYRIPDFPLTAEVLRTGRPHAVSFLDEGVDRAEAFILRELGMNALLMLPLMVGGTAWGLVELYEMRLRRFSEDAIAVAQFLTGRAERRLEALGATEAGAQTGAVYDLPLADGAAGASR